MKRSKCSDEQIAYRCSICWFQRHECVAALLRPDNYVYGIARSAAEAIRFCEAAGSPGQCAPRTSPNPCSSWYSDLHQFNPPVLCAPLLGLVGSHRARKSYAMRRQAVVAYALLHQRRDHCRRATLRQVPVERKSAHVVGMAHNEQLQRRVVAHQLGNLLQGGVGLGLDIGLVEIEMDAVERDSPHALYRGAHFSSLDRDHSLLSLFGLDDVDHGNRALI